MKLIFTRRISSLLLFSLTAIAAGAPAEADLPEAEASQSPHGTVLLQADLPSSPALRAELPIFPPDDYIERRVAIVDLTIKARGVADKEVLRAMRRVPRHLFVPVVDISRAYGDHPLSIEHGQTISQPYIVGYMTELLDLEPGDRVLEVGTGSAYQAAILAEIAREVVSIEIIDALAHSAAERISDLGYKNITVISGDGYFGWEERAPYDAIIVTAAAKHVPPPLVKQLKPGGRMAIPVGRTGWTQNLMVVEKALDGSVKSRNVLAVRFVPLTRKRR